VRLIVQRVASAAVTWRRDSTEQRHEIGSGLAILAGAGGEDSSADAQRLARKVAGLRIFADDQGLSNLSLLDVGGEALVISQFTLLADLSRGRRPSFIGAGDPETAARRIEEFVTELRGLGVSVKTGEFGAHMVVEIANDGPVTFALSTDDWSTRV
jgi:D-aminoacyl-tRNA deacylase